MSKYYLAHRTATPDFGDLEGQYIHFDQLLFEEPPLDAKCIFIEAVEDTQALSIIEAIRGKAYPCLYPVPIILAGEVSVLSERLILAADNVLSPKELAHIPDSLIRFIEGCFKRIERFPDKRKPMDTNLAFKIIRHAYVRNARIVPHRCIWDLHGWVYPQLLPYTGSSSENLVQLFEFMELQGIFSSEFHNKTFACSQCQCAFLSFRESCPHCGSINLKLDDIVHHFPCAYIGPQVDFLKDDILVCPKCDKELRHIGVDYDKPSIVYTCNDCTYNCQDPSVSTECFHCGRQAMPEEVNLRSVNIYSLTALGNNASIYGMDSLFRNILSEKVHAMTIDIFKKFLSLEIDRIKRYKRSESTLIYINIQNLNDAYIKLGGKATSIFNELSAIIVAILRKSDIMTIINNSFFLIILVETSISGSEHVMNRIKDGVFSLLSSNLKTPVNVQGGALTITGEDEADAMIAKAAENVSS